MTESNRLAALESFRILGTPPEEMFDEVAKLAAQICSCAEGFLTFVDAEIAWCKSSSSMPKAIPRSASFSEIVVSNRDIVIIEDTLKDGRFKTKVFASGTKPFRFFAGAPLITLEGDCLGALAVMDYSPRKFSELETENLRLLSKTTMSLLEMRTKFLLRETMGEAMNRGGNAFLHGLLENLADGVVACDEKGELILFNRASRELHGLHEAPVDSTKWGEYYRLFQPDGTTPLQSEEIPLFRAFRSETVKDQEMFVRRRDGSGVRLLASGNRLQNIDGTLGGAVIVMRDVTKRFEDEKELRAAKEAVEKLNLDLEDKIQVRTHELRNSERRYRSILEQSPFPVQIFTVDGLARQVNRAWENLWEVPEGYGSANWVGRYNILNDPELTHLGVLDTIKIAFAGNAVSVGPVQYKPSEIGTYGKIRWIQMIINPVRGADGSVLEILVVSMDVTDSRVAEEKIRSNERLLQAIIDNSSAVIYVKDLEGRNVLTNRAYETIFNLPPGGAIGRFDFEIFPAEISGKLREMTYA
ncbi:MAG: PAS domain S-box protein [Cryobacterium sp.]|nr:PAS domain S-box protein [Oligoflexia bacterium]